MEATYSEFSLQNSLERITEILDSSDASYDDHSGIPSRNALTFTNGYYVDVTVIFVDLRGSKGLAEKHTRPVLAKIYRTYVSEMVAIFRGSSNISEINIEGDGVWAVFDTKTKMDVQKVVETAAKVGSLVDIINIKLLKKNYSAIRVGIGVEDGSTLYIKAGYKNSGINEIVWIGRTVGKAAHLCDTASRGLYGCETRISTRVWENLPSNYQDFFSYISADDCYEANIVNVEMNAWVQENEV